MKLTSDQVKKVAKLANLQISEADELKYTKQLSAILDYFDQLNKVHTENVEPTFNVTGNSNVLAEDEIKESLSQNEALQNASNKKEGFFVTKGVFEEKLKIKNYE